jgi:hypothetical protein
MRRVLLFSVALAALMCVLFLGGSALAGGPTAPLPPSASGTLTNDAYTPNDTPTPVCVLAWRAVTSPVSGPDVYLRGVDVITADDVWAVGYSGSPAHALTLHWDGNAWAVVPNPLGGVESYLYAVSGTASNDVWAVGKYNPSAPSSLIMHWNGSSWTYKSGPNSASSPILYAVEAISPNDVWAVGAQGTNTSLINHYDGTSWSILPSQNIAQLYGLASTGPNDVWAVGALGFLHWDGGAWARVNGGVDLGANLDVDVSAPNDVWTVSSGVQHWNGSQWSISQVPGGSSVEALSPNDVWVTSTNGNGMLHYDGVQWSTVPSPYGDGMSSISAASPSDIWAVGPGGVIERYSYECTFGTVTPSTTPTFTHTPGIINTPTPTHTRTNTRTPGPTNTPTNTPIPPCSPPSYQVFVLEYLFTPSQIYIREGGMVRWRNIGSLAHTSTSDTGVWDSGLINPGGTFEITLNTPGVYHYHCAIHPQMTGIINVRPCPPPPARVMMGHVTWDGRNPQPDPSQVLPISLTLRSTAGGPYIDYPLQETDENGYFSVDVTNLPNGDYNWRVKGPEYLANSGIATLAGDPVTPVEMGLMLVGDSNNDNNINIADFTVIKPTFGFGCGQASYDDRAEFTGDCTVNITDFNYFKRNFGTTGSPPLRP